jgi:hypothetical protein
VLDGGTNVGRARDELARGIEGEKSARRERRRETERERERERES